MIKNILHSRIFYGRIIKDKYFEYKLKEKWERNKAVYAEKEIRYIADFDEHNRLIGIDSVNTG